MNIRSLAERGNRVPSTRRHGFTWGRYRDEAMELTTWVLKRWGKDGQWHMSKITVADVIFRDATVRGDKMAAWALCKARRQLREAASAQNNPPNAPFSLENGG